MNKLVCLALLGAAWVGAQESVGVEALVSSSSVAELSSAEIAPSSSSGGASSSSAALPESSSSSAPLSSVTVPAPATAPAPAAAPVAPAAASSASAQPAAPGSVASSSSAATAASAAAPADSAQAGGDASKMSFGGSVSIGTMTLNGEQVNRISYRPEWTIGSLGVAFDLELFVNSQGKPMSYGWEFDSRDEALNSLYRKIYYVRWNQPGDGFYVRAGALENINVDAARLITSDFGNVANYPGQKLVGVHLQLNDWFEPLGASVEFVNNSLEDWSHRGGVVGGKFSIKPLGSLGLPIVSKLRWGALAVVDVNQLATVRDRDGDNCPDQLDDSPRNASVCRYLVSYVDPETFERIYGNSDSLASYLADRNATRVLDESTIQNRFGENDAFTLLGTDYLLPLLRWDFLELDIYGEFARPYVNPETDSFDLNDSWGLVPAGAALRLGILDAGLEYRQLQGRFVTGHFNAAYEMERVRFMNGTFLTKEQTEWETAEDPGSRKGVYGRASLDLLGFMDVGGSYSHLWSEEGPADRSYTGSAGLGEKVIALIPKMKKLEVFYNKNHVGREGDNFIERNVFTTHGYRVGFELAGGFTVIVTNLTSYTRDDEGALRPTSNFLAETVLTF